MIALKNKKVNFAPIFGIGYWKDIYKDPFKGYQHNLVLPFFKISWGILEIPETENEEYDR